MPNRNTPRAMPATTRSIDPLSGGFSPEEAASVSRIDWSIGTTGGGPVAVGAAGGGAAAAAGSTVAGSTTGGRATGAGTTVVGGTGAAAGPLPFPPLVV